MPDVGAAQLAHLFDCTERTILDLARKGIVTRIGRGRYDAAASIRGYISHLRAIAAGRQVEPAARSVRTQSPPATDPNSIDPCTILAAIAADAAAPASARVAACRELLGLRTNGGKKAQARAAAATAGQRTDWGDDLEVPPTASVN